jgi:glycine/D-amino acid oxidase-like deaminating enzyme
MEKEGEIERGMDPDGLQKTGHAGGEIRHYEPGLATDISLVLYNPHDPQLNALQLVRAYACAAERLGATFHTREEVIAIDYHHERVIGVRTSQEKMGGDSI